MGPLGAFPLTIRSDFTEETKWGLLSDLRRYEVSTPKLKRSTSGDSESAGCVHASRSSLIVHIGGGHLRAPVAELLHRIEHEVPIHLDVARTGPAEHIRDLVGWIEREQQTGFLERAYITATVIVAVSDTEVWTWLVSPHGVVHGAPSAMVFGSTDLRYPVLRRLGVMKEPAFEFPGTEAGDNASSIFCIGTPAGYETTRTPLRRSEIVVGLDRGSLPFGPWPEEPIALVSVWGMDAAWRHGKPGMAVALGCVREDDLRLPEAWEVREVPLELRPATR